jgi:hypothetical protein
MSVCPRSGEKSFWMDSMRTWRKEAITARRRQGVSGIGSTGKRNGVLKTEKTSTPRGSMRFLPAG